MRSRFLYKLVLVGVLTLPSAALGETLARCGEGWLERIHGVLVLHVKGSPYEMGYQHGALLRDHCQQNFNYLLGTKAAEIFDLGPLKFHPRKMIDTIAEMQRKHVPPSYYEELQGVADGSGLSVEDVRAANFIPELFHCSGFAVMNSATKDGTLYHGRILDYACDWRLQEHAVVLVAEPDEGIPFVNITYAGFIGSVTGMNAQHVSIGEMGGPGLGHWDGVPMAVLMRQVIQHAHDLDEALAVFRNNPRTCVYYYVIADGKTNRAQGVATNWKKMITVSPGEAHNLLPRPVPDAVLLSRGLRYDTLVDRALAGHGKIDAQAAIDLMDQPVAMNSNLHNVLFEPRSTKFWVAQASIDRKPAATQPYHAFQLTELLKRVPAGEARQIPMARSAAPANAAASLSPAAPKGL